MPRPDAAHDRGAVRRAAQVALGPHDVVEVVAEQGQPDAERQAEHGRQSEVAQRLGHDRVAGPETGETVLVEYRGRGRDGGISTTYIP